jgi:3'-5' exoribonuclease
MKDKTIRSFEVGEEVEGFFLIRSLNLKTSTNNKKYLDFALADSTGEINSKFWDLPEDLVGIFKVGDVVKIRGTVTSWQSSLQLKVTKMRLSESADEVRVETLVQSAPESSQSMMAELRGYVGAIQKPKLRELVNCILDEYAEKFELYPAAKKHHHAIRSGLLYHVLRMLRSADVLCGIYGNLDRDLVYAGVILHDIEKINEMHADDLGIVSTYSFEGQVLGHIIMGIKKIDTVAQAIGLDQELSLLLQHLILTHHYEPQYGSPKKPSIPEGELLHYLDMIDARMYDMEKAVEGVEPGAFSDGVQSIDYRRIYKPQYMAEGAK